MPKGIHGSKAPHGTTARYQHHGCRCGECRVAWREASRRYYGRMSHEEWEAVRPVARHGTASKYDAGCRCDDCRRASADARRGRRHRAAARAAA